MFDRTALVAQPPLPMLAAIQRRILFVILLAMAFGLAYLLRGVIFQLFFAFLLAYALDPLVDRLEAAKVPRALGAIIVLLGLFTFFATVAFLSIPYFVDEVRDAARDLPTQVSTLEKRLAPWLWNTFKVRVPSILDLGNTIRERFSAEGPDTMRTVVLALFGTLGYVAVLLSALIIPVFALYLLIDFDRIVARAGALIPRRWNDYVRAFAKDVHVTLRSYVRGQITANLVLAALYALGLSFAGIRLAVPIGILTGMLGFVPYIGFMSGLLLAVVMAALDPRGVTIVVQVIAVMGAIQVLDGLVVTPRIVGRSVGLSPLEVLLTMMAAGSLFGFFGVLFAVPLGAVLKIASERFIQYYLSTEFYRKVSET